MIVAHGTHLLFTRLCYIQVTYTKPRKLDKTEYLVNECSIKNWRKPCKKEESLLTCHSYVNGRELDKGGGGGGRMPLAYWCVTQKPGFCLSNLAVLFNHVRCTCIDKLTDCYQLYRFNSCFVIVIYDKLSSPPIESSS